MTGVTMAYALCIHNPTRFQIWIQRKNYNNNEYNNNEWFIRTFIWPNMANFLNLLAMHGIYVIFTLCTDSTQGP